MQRGFISYGRQEVTDDDVQAVVAALKSRFITQGPVIEEFEQNIAQKCTAEYAVAVNSATSALHIACIALGLRKGGRIWTSPISFVASANCGIYCGAEVDFVDIDSKSGLIDISLLEAKLENARKCGKLPDILIPVHLGGCSCDMKSIKELSNRYGFHIVEDASHAIGGYYEGSPIGSCIYSDICVFSFHPVKIITTGEGGAALTNNIWLAERMKMYRSHGITRDRSLMTGDNPPEWAYEQHELGFNYRMTEINAALGNSQLKRLDEIVAERRRLRDIYAQRIERISRVSMVAGETSKESSVHLGAILIDKSCSETQRKVFRTLRGLDIGVQIHYIPIHTQPYFQRLGFRLGDFPVSEEYSLSTLSLPLYPGLKEEEQEYVIQSLETAIKEL